jgi:serine/threonine-protein kinase
MTCTRCHAELETVAAFCGECGERVYARPGTLTGALLDGRFQIEAKLAAGGFGSIYRATDRETGAMVALKVLHADLARDRNLSARFRREAAALSRLSDAHTITMRELREADDGTLFIVMELLRGHSLLDRFRMRGPLPWRQMIGIGLGVCSSLAEAHRLGIVHRDLKPANIHLETRDGSSDFVKVLDFGIAKLVGSVFDDGADLTRVGQTVGTIEYMAPEQLVGMDCDGRTDLYTLGIVLYEMITGHRPFADATGPTSLVTALMTRTPAPPSTLHGCQRVPPALDRILLRCLERDPELRYRDVDELASALERLLLAHPDRSAMSRTTLQGSGTGRQLAVAADDETTLVDALPPIMIEPTTAVLSKTPYLDAPPTLPVFDCFANGSSVGPPPSRRPAIPRALWTLLALCRSVDVALAVARIAI